MKTLFSVALLCLCATAFAQTLPLVPYTLTLSSNPNQIGYYWLDPGEAFNVTYRLYSEVGMNARTSIQQQTVGPDVVCSLGTIPSVTTNGNAKLYIDDQGSDSGNRLFTIPANTAKDRAREIWVKFEECYYISAPTVKGKPNCPTYNGFVIYQPAANSIITNTGTKASNTSISLYYSSDDGKTWQSWRTGMSARRASRYLFKALFSCSSTTKLGRFTIIAFGKSQVIYDTEYEWISTSQNFSGDVTVKFSASLSNYPIDL